MPATLQLRSDAYAASAFKCYFPLLKKLFNHQPYSVTAAAFWEAFALLPETAQQMLRLKYERGYKLTEIAREMDCHISKVNYWFCIGKNGLRRLLNPQAYSRQAGVMRLEWVRG